VLRALHACGATQIEGQREIRGALLHRHEEWPGCVAVILEPREAARLGLVAVDRECVVVAPAGMGDMIDAAAERITLITFILQP